jgi:hypothetical protein
MHKSFSWQSPRHRSYVTSTEGGNGFKNLQNRKQARDEADLFCARLSQLPAAPVAMMMVVMVTMPAVPPVMMVVVMTVPPMHLRGRRPGIFLNRRGGAGIAERQCVGALGRSREREHCADGSEPQYLRELHEYSPCLLVTSASNRSPQRCA